MRKKRIYLSPQEKLELKRKVKRAKNKQANLNLPSREDLLWGGKKTRSWTDGKSLDTITRTRNYQLARSIEREEATKFMKKYRKDN